MKDTFSLREICDWYSKNTDTEINIDFLVYFVTRGIITSKDIGVYSKSDFDSFILESNEGEFVTREDGRYIVKETRKKLNNEFSKSKDNNTKFKLANLNGGKLKLIKL